MRTPLPSDIQYISDTKVAANESKSLIWWLAYVCFAYHYKDGSKEAVLKTLKAYQNDALIFFSERPLYNIFFAAV